jgi:site-specific recombinase XerD
MIHADILRFAGEWGEMVSGGKMILHEAIELFLLNYRQSTQVAYRKDLAYLADFVGPGRPLASITAVQIVEWIQHLRTQNVKYATHPKRPAEHAPLAPATLYKAIKTVKVFFNWAVTQKLVSSSPADHIRNPRPGDTVEGRAASTEEMNAVIDAARPNPRDYAVVLLLAESGCRRGDIASLRLQDLDLARLCAYVVGKGEKRRAIYFDHDAVEAIAAWLRVRPATENDRVFVTAKGEPLSGQAVYQIAARRSRDAGLGRTVNPHRFRHGVATALAAERLKPTAIQRYLGHSSILTTMRYIHATEEDMHEAARVLVGRRSGKRKSRRNHPEVAGGHFLFPFQRPD